MRNDYNHSVRRGAGTEKANREKKRKEKKAEGQSKREEEGEQDVRGNTVFPDSKEREENGNRKKSGRRLCQEREQTIAYCLWGKKGGKKRTLRKKSVMFSSCEQEERGRKGGKLHSGFYLNS